MVHARFKIALPVLVILSVAHAPAQNARIERVGWAVVWPDSIDCPRSFCERVEARLIQTLEDLRSAQLRWIRLADQPRSELAAASYHTLPPYDLLPDWKTRYDQIVLVRLQRHAGRWLVHACTTAPWLPHSRFAPPLIILDRRLLPLEIAQLISETCVPSIRLTALTDGRVQLAGPSITPRAHPTAAALKAGTVHRVLCANDLNRTRRYRVLRHAFVKVLSTSTDDGTPLAKLVAIKSDERAIHRALAADQPVLLAPAEPVTGRIRLRAIDADTREPAPYVEVFASPNDYSTNARDLKAVTAATGEPIEFSDPQGQLWYVTLKSGTRVYQLPLTNSVEEGIFDIPITAGDESLLRGELNYIVDDFNQATDRYRHHLHHGDTLTEQKRFAKAQQAYQQAQAACRDAIERCDAAERLYERYHSDGEEDESDRACVEQFTQAARREAATRTREIEARIKNLTGLEESTSRQARAHSLEVQAIEHRDRNDIDEALRLYDAAIALVPPELPYYQDLVTERGRLAEAWRIRGGEKQQRARQFVYDQFGLLSAADLANELPQVQAHIECLIDCGDRYTLRKAIGPVDKLFKDVMAAARAARDAGEADGAQRWGEVAKALNLLRARIEDTMQSAG